MQRFSDSLSRHGPAVNRKFFVENGVAVARLTIARQMSCLAVDQMSERQGGCRRHRCVTGQGAGHRRRTCLQYGRCPTSSSWPFQRVEKASAES